MKVEDRIGPLIKGKEWLDFWLSYIMPEDNTVYRSKDHEVNKHNFNQAKKEYEKPNNIDEFANM
jgi:hypothetical protein